MVNNHGPWLVSPITGVIPFINGLKFLWLVKRGDPNHLYTSPGSPSSKLVFFEKHSPSKAVRTPKTPLAHWSPRTLHQCQLHQQRPAIHDFLGIFVDEWNKEPTQMPKPGFNDPRNLTQRSDPRFTDP